MSMLPCEHPMPVRGLEAASKEPGNLILQNRAYNACRPGKRKSEIGREGATDNALVFDHFPCRPRIAWRKKTIVCGELLNWTENTNRVPFFPFPSGRADFLCLSFFFFGLGASAREDGLCILIAHWQRH